MALKEKKTNHEDMVFERPTKGRIKVSREASGVMASFRQIGRKTREAGGVILGRWIVDSDDIVIDQVTVPQPADFRARSVFKRAQPAHQSHIARIWEETHGSVNYLGEWHTHPESFPTPSGHDLDDWKRLLNETKCDADVLFFFIQGTDQLSGWEGNKKTRKILPMNPYSLNLKDKKGSGTRPAGNQKF